jgi:hypothetical protein
MCRGRQPLKSFSAAVAGYVSSTIQKTSGVENDNIKHEEVAACLGFSLEQHQYALSAAYPQLQRRRRAVMQNAELLH